MKANLNFILALSTLFFNCHLKAIDEWRTPLLEDLVYLELSTGKVVIELAPFMAPKHVKQFKALVREGFYDGLDFYRVIDGFVAQGGDLIETKPSQHAASLDQEFTRPAPDNSSFLPVQRPDFMAPQTGFLQGFPAGRDPHTKEEWLLHCPGAVAMARSTAANSGSTDFYIVIGQATRHLDRNMTTFGKVIYGMPVVQSLQRAHLNNSSGVIDDPSQRSKILSAKLAADIPVQQRLLLQVQNERSVAVTQRLQGGRGLDNEFFHFKGNGNLDICYYQLRAQLKNKS